MFYVLRTEGCDLLLVDFHGDMSWEIDFKCIEF